VIYQTDAEFNNPAIYHYGCYLLSLCERLTTHFDLPFTHLFVLEVLQHGRLYKWIDEEITLLDPQDLCDYVVPGKVSFLGHYPAGRESLDDELEIVCYHKSGASFNHFVSGNGKGICIYDPWSADGSDSVRNGEIIGKRIYRII
jgi:hypothetical protein